MNKTAKQIIEKLKLEPHPEGGHYRQIFKDKQQIDGRSRSSSIYYLLAENERSHWHKIDAIEIWHFYAGAPLKLSISNGSRIDEYNLGSNIFANQRPQIIVEQNQWQSAISLGEWTLVGCTVAPGFEFSGFELAPVDWSPTKA